jgi:hypothetical protein
MARGRLSAKVSYVPEAILRDIRRLHREHAPMNLSAMKRRRPELLSSVYALRPFVGWRGTLAAAGIDYSDIKFELDELVTCPLCGKSFKSLGAHIAILHQADSVEVRLEHPEQDFVSEELRARLSRMENAVLPHWEPIWTPEYMLDRVWEFHKQGAALNAEAIDSLDPPLYLQAIHRWKSWENALTAIGVAYSEVTLKPNRGKYSTPEAILSSIATRHARGEPLAPSLLLSGDRPLSALVENARKFFGSWRQALMAAGVDPARAMLHEVGRFPNAQAVVSAIRGRHGQSLSLAPTALQKGSQADLALFEGARRHFGDWDTALSMAGFDPRNWRRVFYSHDFSTREQVIIDIQRRSKSGVALNRNAVQHDGGSGGRLVRQARKLFGSWPSALVAAGIDPAQHVEPRRSRYREPEAVVREIRRRHQIGLPVNAAAIQRGASSDRSLYKKGRDLFGSWDEALRKAGLEPNDQRPPRKLRFPSSSSVRAAIQDRVRRGISVQAGAVSHLGPERDCTLYHRATRYFGSWAAALEAAGYDPWENTRVSVAHWQPSAIIDHIRRRRENEAPLNPTVLRRQGTAMEKSLIRAATVYFGSWDRALQAAGIPAAAGRLRNPPASKRYPTCESILKVIRQRARPANTLGSAEIRHDLGSPFLRRVRELFGSWRSALAAAGVTPADKRLRQHRVTTS